MSDLPQRLPGQLDIDEVIELVERGEGSVSRRMRKAAATSRTALPTLPKRLSVAEIVQQKIRERDASDTG
jgi:hypothetical protein